MDLKLSLRALGCALAARERKCSSRGIIGLLMIDLVIIGLMVIGFGVNGLEYRSENPFNRRGI